MQSAAYNEYLIAAADVFNFISENHLDFDKITACSGTTKWAYNEEWISCLAGSPTELRYAELFVVSVQKRKVMNKAFPQVHTLDQTEYRRLFGAITKDVEVTSSKRLQKRPQQ